jgi:hypothetical protein
MAGKEAAGDGTFGPDHPSSICEALCEVEQERISIGRAIA